MKMHSFTAPHNKIEWKVKLHGDIRRWPDVRDEYELNVLRAPRPFFGFQEPFADEEIGCAEATANWYLDEHRLDALVEGLTTITIIGDYGNADVGVGSVVDIDGRLRAPETFIEALDHLERSPHLEKAASF